jgi:phosphoserine phosphatase
VDLTGIPEAAMDSWEVPLCVDLDGTLVACDTLHASVAALARTRLWACGLLPLHILRGRAAFKRAVADRFVPDPQHLPYRPDVLSFLTHERQRGRRILLVTAADRRIADPVAEHVNLFDDVLASDGRSNVKGPGKVAAIRRHLSGGPFDYIGDSMADIPVFAAARYALLAHPSPRLRRLAERWDNVAHVFASP